MAGLETLALIGTIGGTLLSAAGAVAQGNAQEAALKAEAQAREARAQEERAVSQREAVRRQREASLVLSRQQAVAAASGGGATDPTVLQIMGGTAAEGGLQARTALYEGEMRGRGLEYQAAVDRMNARQAKLAGYVNAGSTMLSGLSSYATTRQQFSGSSMPTYHYG